MVGQHWHRRPVECARHRGGPAGGSRSRPRSRPSGSAVRGSLTAQQTDREKATNYTRRGTQQRKGRQSKSSASPPSALAHPSSLKRLYHLGKNVLFKVPKGKSGVILAGWSLPVHWGKGRSLEDRTPGEQALALRAQDAQPFVGGVGGVGGGWF